MNEQLSLFTEPNLCIRTPVRLIEMFSGIGAQAKAMERLGADFETWRAYDIDKYAVQAYNAIHGTSFVPTDITKIHADDLGICDRDKFTYLLTYSFPCQDLSGIGLKKGYGKGSDTRSGLLWEVERILKECGDNLPQILLMENVPHVCQDSNRHDFDQWKESLMDMGYTNTYRVLNALDYGIPQNRERCFMISWLGHYQYQWPDPIHLNRDLSDYVEQSVDRKYYLTESQLRGLREREKKQKAMHNGFGTFIPIDPSVPGAYAKTLCVKYRRGTDNYLHDATGIRRLSPKEYWRLMDFADRDFKNAAEVVSVTQLYKQAGNSICVNVLVAVFGQMFEGKETVYRDRFEKGENDG